ncbi:MAG: hypothetical protein KAX49_19855 [Halanaerobiales bacterium]|nr:hypothetical protein [Halanaerobiales bacterium]
MKPDIFSMLENFVDDRSTMSAQNQNIHGMIGFLRGEIEELEEALGEEASDDAIIEEASDLVILSISILQLLNGNIDNVREKIGFNTLRYPAYLFHNGLSYEEAVIIGKNGFTQQDKDEIYND